MRDDFPVLINLVRDELISVLDEHLQILRAELEVCQPWGRAVTFKEFDACGAPHFLREEGDYH